MKNLLFLLLCLATCVQAVDLRGRVVAVSDGDTATVLDAERTFFIVLADIRRDLEKCGSAMLGMAIRKWCVRFTDCMC